MKFITYGLIGAWSQTLQIKLPSVSRVRKVSFHEQQNRKKKTKTQQIKRISLNKLCIDQN